jgi:probable F420-dependent oxidoreductase
MRPFRFGVIAESAQTAEQLLHTARRAEEVGCSILLMRDHLVEDPFLHQLGPLTALTAVAAATTTLRVGTLVISNDFRHPSVLAKEFATLDVLSGGRAELGMGAGFLRRDFEEAGLRFDPPDERVGRLEESLRLLKSLFGPDPVTHLGRHYTVRAMDSFPKPVQKPHPPIHVAAALPRMLAIAAREADIVGIQAVSTARGVVADDPRGRAPSTLRSQIERVKEAAGERFDDLELSTTATIVVADNPRAGADQIARQRGWSGVAWDEVLDMPSSFVGPVEHIIELFYERREKFGISYWIMLDRALDAAAPVLAGLIRREASAVR